MLLVLCCLCFVTEGYAQEIVAPVFLEKVKPGFPKQGIQAGIQGSVLLNVYLNADGKIGGVEVLRGLGNWDYGFEDASIEAMKQWRFIPGQVNGKPATVRMALELEFYLHSDAREPVVSWEEPGMSSKKVYPPKVTRLTHRGDPDKTRSVPLTVRLKANGSISVFWSKELKGKRIQRKIRKALENYYFQTAVGDGHAIPCTLTFNLELRK